MADSILKDIYNDVKAELLEITEFSGGNIDLYKNQIASITTFPYALIDFPYIYYKDSTARVQLGNTMVRVMVCMDLSDLAGSDVTDIFELKDKVYVALQGVRKQSNPPYPPDDKPKYAPLTRGTERTETKYEGIYVFEMDFYTTIQDDGAYILKNYTAKYNVALEMEKDGIAPNGRIELNIENLGEGKNNEIRTGKIV